MQLIEHHKQLLRFAVIVFLAMAIFPLGKLLFFDPAQTGELFYTARGNVATTISDFIHFYAAGRMAVSPDRFQVFDPNVQLKWINLLISPAHTENVFYMQYVPFIFPLMVPFAPLSLPIAYFAWDGLMVLMGASSLFLLSKGKTIDHRQSATILVLYSLISLPCILTLKLGQTTWFLVALLSCYYYSLRHNRSILGGISLALVAIKPQYVILLSVPALALRRWRLIASAAIAEFVLLAASAICIGWQNVVFFPQIVMNAEANPQYWGVAPALMISLRALLSNYLPTHEALRIAVFIMVLMLPVLWALWRRTELAGPNAWPWAYALTILICLIFSPHSHPYDSLLVSVSAALTLIGNKNTKPQPAWIAWAAMLFLFPILSWIFYGSSLGIIFKRLPFLATNVLLLAAGIPCWLASLKSPVSSAD